MKQDVVRAIGLHSACLLLAVLPVSAGLAAEPPLPERNPFHALKPALDSETPVASNDVPLPERRPVAAKAKAETKSKTSVAKKDTPPVAWTDAEIAAAKAECERLTKGLTVDMRYVAPIREGQCGTAQPVEVRSLGSGQKVTLVPPAVMNCRMVAMLTRWLDTSVQPKAKAILGKPIVRLTNASAYVCRNRYNAKDQKLSEHAKANALDVSGFITSDGRDVAVVSFWGPTMAELEAKRFAEAEKAAAAANTVKKSAVTSATTASAAPETAAGWAATSETASTTPPLPEQPVETKSKSKSKLAKPAGLGALVKGEPLIATGSKLDHKRKRGTLVARPAEYAPKTPEGKFLQAVHADACETFGTVLGPEANYAHHDHLHLDLAPRRTSNFCQ